MQNDVTSQLLSMTKGPIKPYFLLLLVDERGHLRAAGHRGWCVFGVILSGGILSEKKCWIDKLKVESEYWTILKQYSLNTNTATATGIG